MLEKIIYMGIDKQNIGNGFHRLVQEPLAPYVLQEQIRLPKDQWNEKFCQLIEEKTRENQQENIKETEESPKVLRERIFKRYLEGLGIDEIHLRGKKILDLGTGGGEFVKDLIEKGITSEAYGVDAQIDESVIEDRFNGHLVQGNFEEDFPIKDIDYIVSVGAVSNGVWGGEEVMKIGRIIEKSLASLKEDGELRIYPIKEAARATPLEGIEKTQQKWKELLKEISEIQKFDWKIEPKNIKVIGGNNDIILDSVLIIKKKKN